jgi:uncharacterized membrane protein HdeD (DUF308 family)
MTDQGRARTLAAAGIAIIALGIGSALLPVADSLPGSLVIGLAMIVAGAIELFAGTLRREVRSYALVAGSVTGIAGLLLLLNPTIRFLPTVTLIILWLAIRAGILISASRHTSDGVRRWMTLSAGMDFLLAVLLFAGLSVATLIISLFGPTPPLIASFAWVLAASFVVNGNMLLEVASCERSAAE